MNLYLPLTLFCLMGLVLFNSVSSTEISSEAKVVQSEFNRFKKKNAKIYVDDEEETRRKQIFADRLKKIKEHNKRFEDGLESYSMKMNDLGDKTADEIQQMLTGSLPKNGIRNKQLNEVTPTPRVGTIPAYLNWNEKGYVTPVENQHHCGCCWAFSATGALESYVFKKTGNLVPLSKQNLVDCIHKICPGLYDLCILDGCKGNYRENALNYILNNGISTEASFPYVGKVQSCPSNGTNNFPAFNGYSYTVPNDEIDLQWAVAKHGPISVNIYADTDTLPFAGTGLYDNPDCDYPINHAVLIVGYGTTSSGKDYWIVKNSWGTHRGDHGYFYMSRNKNNQCRIASDGIYIA